MSVFVDPLFDTRGWSERWPYSQACHMTADTVEELHAMAAKLGLKRQWFQDAHNHWHKHYDLTASKRKLALKLGAVEHSSREWGAKMLAEAEKLKEKGLRPV